MFVALSGIVTIRDPHARRVCVHPRRVGLRPDQPRQLRPHRRRPAPRRQPSRQPERLHGDDQRTRSQTTPTWSPKTTRPPETYSPKALGRDWVDRPSIARRDQLHRQQQLEPFVPGEEDELDDIMRHVRRRIAERENRERRSERSLGIGLSPTSGGQPAPPHADRIGDRRHCSGRRSP